MALYAFKNGDPESRYTEERMNSLLTAQGILLVYEGQQIDAKTGGGVVENNLANASFCTRFTLLDSTELSRIEIDIDRDNQGADLIVQIRTGMNPASGIEGDVIAQVVVPKEFIPEEKKYWSVPLGLSGLTSGEQYWLVILRAGNATDKLDWVGETTQDTNHPSYYQAQEGSSWVACNALHFKAFGGTGGELLHSIYAGTAYTTIQYDGGKLTKVYRYIPPADGPEGGVRDVVTYTWSGEYLLGGEV